MLALSQVVPSFAMYDHISVVILGYLVDLCSSIFHDMLVVVLIMLIIKPTRKWVQEHGRLILVTLAILLAIEVVLAVIVMMLGAYFAG